MTKRVLRLFLLVCATASSAIAANPVEKKVVLSPVYSIDRIYRSMEGPQSSEEVFLTGSDPAELLWLVGISTEMVGADGRTPMSPGLMCHVNVDIDISAHKELFGWEKSVNRRIVTLSQGQLSARYPEGLGMPLMSDEALQLTTQVLNLNLPNPDLKVRHRVTFEFVRDRDAKEPMRPLYNAGIFGMALLEGPDGIFGKALDDTAAHGTSCMIGSTAPNAMGGAEYRDPMGRVFTGHWVVKPGREVNHTNVTRLLDLPFDTTLHYAAVHLHPFAESLELRDLTTGRSVFRSEASGPKRGIGLTRVTSFSSREGVALYKDHEYELVSIYNNTTKSDQDSMAVMYLAPLDREFARPEEVARRRAERAEAERRALLESDRLLLRTVAGDMVFRLRSDSAPKTVAQFEALVRGGLYDGLLFTRVEPGFLAQTSVAESRDVPLDAAQKLMIVPIPLEKGPLVHQRGALAMAREDGDPDSARTSFYIALGDAPHLDGQYTIFGTLESGLEALDAIEKVPTDSGNRPLVRVRILKAEILPGQKSQQAAR